MIVITGAAGFIASCLVAKLNEENFVDLVLVDHFENPAKAHNYQKKKYTALVNRDEFATWLDENHRFVQFIFHLGARTDTTEFDTQIFDRLNVGFSQMVWNKCIAYGLPMIYASSAATYGDGSLGYFDSHEIVSRLQPLNPYGKSKNDFDLWAIQQPKQPYFWAGFKFFNVYGPNEFHKGRMASVVFHAFHQIRQNNKMKLFRSHKPEYKDGEQQRDFIYVKDVVNVLYFFMNERKHNGIYNLGTGIARSFKDLATSTFKAMGIEPVIDFVDTPADIRNKYQYFTQAEILKLRLAGYKNPFYKLEEGIQDYVTNYLMPQSYY